MMRWMTSISVAREGGCEGRDFVRKKARLFLVTLIRGPKQGGDGMRSRSITAGIASLMLVTMIAAGCAQKKEEAATATRAEQAAARAEDAARRAESAASRVEAAAQRAEAAAEKAERMFSKHLRK